MDGAKQAVGRRVAIVGAGAMGCAAAAYLQRSGHAPALWSPTAARVRGGLTGRARFTCTGALDGEVEAELLESAVWLREFPVILVCIPADAYAAVLEPLNTLWRTGQHVILSGALSLAPLWVEEEARGRDQQLRVTGWGTTLTTAYFQADGRLHVNPLRQRIDMASVGRAPGPTPLEVCEALFGPRFALADNLLAPALANINPIAHAAEVIPNLTRMDAREQWSLFGCFTSVVGRLADDLDAERRAVAAGFGLRLPSLREHYARSYHVQEAELHLMAQDIVRKGMSPQGPASLLHRYVLEDAPFGLAVLEMLGRCAGVDTPVLAASLTMLESAYRRNFRTENFLLDRLGIAGTDAAVLRARCAS